MITRAIEKELAVTSEEYPVVTIVGPRQSGKTTLARKFYSEYRYVNLEDPESRGLAIHDPKTFLHNYHPPLIIDEIQNVPELLSWIQVLVDENPSQKSGFVLTGSHQFRLRQAVTQSLAGRTALLTLFPFSLEELPEEHVQADREDILLKGFMPRLFDQNIRPHRFYSDYFQTYVERDVRKLMAIEDQQAFELLLRLLAARTGREINYADLSKQIGISAPQIKKWLSLLEASYIIFRLPPFFTNYGKRLVKAPKIYFVEPGLAVYLLGIETSDQLARDPAFGGLFENMIVAEALKKRYNSGKAPNLYFFRDKSLNEVDLLFPDGPSFKPIEIKSSRTFKPDFIKGISYYRKLAGINIKGVLINDGDLDIDTQEARVLNFRRAFSILDQ